MYTGIVQGCLPVVTLARKEGLCTFSVEFPDTLLMGLETGASVAVNGVCFTVTGIKGRAVTFDAIKETLELSNIHLLEVGSLVNIERSARADAEVGGHLLSGHVAGTARLASIEESENNSRLTFEGNTSWLRFVFEKGYLAINGASLTVAALDRANNRFAVNLIPETLARTNFSTLGEGNLVNIEIDAQARIIVETVERIMAERF